MAKNDKAASKIDAIGCAERCETQAKEIAEAMPSLSQQLTEAAGMLRLMHQALSETTCQHVMTFVVTKQMIDSGRESREAGRYCMTCGERLADKPKPEKPKKEKPGESHE